MISKTLRFDGLREIRPKAPLRRAKQLRRAGKVVSAAEAPESPDQVADDFEGLNSEEDWVVPGTNMNMLSQNTELGQAVSRACDEMEMLGDLEADVLKQAEAVLQRFGYKSPFVKAPPSEEPAEPDAQEAPDSKLDAK
jgi:hypothetical protein